MTPLEQALQHFPRDIVTAVARSLSTIAEITPTCEKDRMDIRIVKRTATALIEFSRLLEK